MADNQQQRGVSPVGAVAGAVADVFGSVTKLITTAPRRIGKSISRNNLYHLRSNNNEVAGYLASLNNQSKGESFVYNSNFQTSSNNNTVIILLIIGIAVLAYFLFNKK